MPQGAWPETDGKDGRRTMTTVPLRRVAGWVYRAGAYTRKPEGSSDFDDPSTGTYVTFATLDRQSRNGGQNMRSALRPVAAAQQPAHRVEWPVTAAAVAVHENAGHLVSSCSRCDPAQKQVVRQEGHP